MKTHPTKGYTIPEVTPLIEVSVITDTWTFGVSRYEDNKMSVDVEFCREVSGLNKEFYGVTVAQFDRLMKALHKSNFEGTCNPKDDIYIRDRGRHPAMNTSAMIVRFKRKE